jgi:transcriptional regulator with XRE-family HTH domain
LALDDFPQNLRVLCSYGRSISDICRRLDINRQQFSKYLNGHSHPSLATLRRICDFFGVDEGEVLLNHADFSELIRLRPPRVLTTVEPLSERVDHLIHKDTLNTDLMERHEGYYHAYCCPDQERGYVIRTVCRLTQKDGNWFSRSLETYQEDEFAVPSLLKYSGLAFEAHNRIMIVEREQGAGQGVYSTMLIASDYPVPSFLPGLTLGVAPEGAHDVSCIRIVWEYLGKKPDLRKAIKQCGVYDGKASELPEYVRNADLGQDKDDFAGLTAYF